VKILKIKKGDIEYEFDKKVSKNSNGRYLMGMQIEPTKSEEIKKMKNEKKTQNLKKIENEEKGNLSLEKGTKIDINDLHEKLGHPAEEICKINRKLYEAVNSRKNGQLRKLCYWENAAEKRQKRTEGKITKTGISFLHRHCIIKIHKCGRIKILVFGCG